MLQFPLQIKNIILVVKVHLTPSPLPAQTASCPHLVQEVRSLPMVQSLMVGSILIKVLIPDVCVLVTVQNEMLLIFYLST